MGVSICLSHFFHKNFSQENTPMLTFKEFVAEDGDKIVLAMRKVRSQMLLVRLKKELEKQKNSLQALKTQKRL